MVPAALVPAREAVVQAREAAVEPASVKAAPMERAGVESAAAEASTVETPSAAVRCVGEIWLAEDCRAQLCSCNAHHAPTFARRAFAIA
jgi:hypothetical protein